MANQPTCIKCECNDCKAKFDIWLDNANRDSEHEPEQETINKVKDNILMHCPVCGSDNK